MPENRFIYYAIIAWGIITIILNRNNAAGTAKWNKFINGLLGLDRSSGTENVIVLRIIYVIAGLIFIVIGLIGLNKC